MRSSPTIPSPLAAEAYTSERIACNGSSFNDFAPASPTPAQSSLAAVQPHAPRAAVGSEPPSAPAADDSPAHLCDHAAPTVCDAASQSVDTGVRGPSAFLDAQDTRAARWLAALAARDLRDEALMVAAAIARHCPTEGDFYRAGAFAAYAAHERRPDDLHAVLAAACSHLLHLTATPKGATMATANLTTNRGLPATIYDTADLRRALNVTLEATSEALDNLDASERDRDKLATAIHEAIETLDGWDFSGIGEDLITAVNDTLAVLRKAVA